MYFYFCEYLLEYCVYEAFEATCASDEVIVMDHARFGRMRIGKCIKVDLGYIGCGADVLNIYDSHCTGKQNCEISADDKDVGATGTCIQGLTQYLEASYTCHKGTQLECMVAS